ncbi:transient receptor potential cation channel subfamily M member-like 2 isoform X1 [Clavelina lepadiformis]|uniref:transient receptor potential cation channel subfamily M member-like 2 isoform X1 n=2 Tax=Clavelina lepadiformis TaxID=159417 RepID=UPI004041BC83
MNVQKEIELPGQVSKSKKSDQSVSQVSFMNGSHMELQPSNILQYGKLKFQGSSANTAKYAVITNEASESVVYDNVMNAKWNIKKPNLIISITGGARNFKMRSRLTREFRRSLIKAAVSTGAWIVTGGTHAGVMKHVGDAIQHDVTARSNKVVALGIATFGIVYDKEKLKKPPKQPLEYLCSRYNSLDKNHSHFILVDDKSVGEYGKEIEFRATLERHISDVTKAPIVCILLQGGPGSLETVYNALAKGTPVVVVGDSGGWANVLASLYSENYNSVTENIISEMLNDQGLNYSSQKLSECTNMARECIKLKKLLSVFSMDDHSSATALDVAILQAVLSVETQKKSVQTPVKDHLRLAFAWNRSDIAQTEILTDDSNVDPAVLAGFFKEALKEPMEAKHAFIKLFLDYGLDLHAHMSDSDLSSLYEATSRKNSPFGDLLERKKTHKRVLKSIIGQEVSYSTEDKVSNGQKAINRQRLTRRSNKIDKNDETKNQAKLRDLFHWALLLNKKETAMLFWHELTEEQFPASVVANRLLIGMAKRSPHQESKDEYKQHAEIYKNLSVGILSKCYDNSPEYTVKTLIRKLDNWGGFTCLQHAVDNKDYEFVSHRAVQFLLDKVWLGGIQKDESKGFWYSIGFWFMLLLCSFFPPLIVCNLIKFEETVDEAGSDDGNLSQDEETGFHSNLETSFTKGSGTKKRSENNDQTYRDPKPHEKLVAFYNAPIVKFVLNVFFYLLFLILFAYILLFNFQEFNGQNIFEGEIVLAVWILVFAFDEIRQITETKVNRGQGFGNKVSNWFDQLDNKLDLLSFVLFLLGFGLRFDKFSFEAARVLLAFAFIVYCLRILSMFTVHEELGPKLLMVGKMLKDIAFFVFILIVFLLAYGVASQSLLYPNESDVGTVFTGILSKPYWQIYGELFLPEIVFDPRADEFNCTYDMQEISAGYQRCPEQNVIVPILSAGYMLLANVLLLNLLIAMFSYTFDSLVTKTGVIWRYQRYALIEEYHYRPWLPVPFSIFSYAWSMLTYVCYGFKENGGKDSAFAKHYSQSDLQHLIRWENHQTLSYLEAQHLSGKDEISSRVQSVTERLDTLANTVDSVSANLGNQKKLSRRVKALEGKLNESNESLQWLICAFRDSNFVPKNQPKEVHIKARTSPYPNTNDKVFRCKVDDAMVPWNVPMHDYSPVNYTAEIVKQLPDWADIHLELEPEIGRTVLPYNQIDHKKKVDRTSYIRPYAVVNGIPRNPMGRTGLCGRGLLGRYGPNHAADPIVTRWRTENGAVVLQENKPVLEFIAIKREDADEWAIPGGMVDPGENISKTLEREFTEESLDGKIDEKIKQFFCIGGTEIYRGYSDDHRNTDNAWIETIAINFHDKSGLVLKDIQLSPGDEAKKVKWKKVDKSLKLFASHEKFIAQVANLHKAYY